MSDKQHKQHDILVEILLNTIKELDNDKYIEFLCDLFGADSLQQMIEDSLEEQGLATLNDLYENYYQTEDEKNDNK